MRPIPVAFHIWFIEVHTYGIGLALTFWFGLRYTERRLRNNGYPWQWVTGMFLWVIVAAIVGARVFSVLPNLSDYRSDPLQIFAIWQGGLSSFGGLIFAVPVGIISSRRRCPEISTTRMLDLIAPVLMACWGMGRLLGPQLMVRGGGHPTTAWFGMYYAGEVGKRLPVPVFQAICDFSIFGILLLVERWLRNQAPQNVSLAAADTVDAAGAVDTAGSVTADSANGAATSQPVGRSLPPAGIVIGVGMVLWGIERYFDEHLWLSDPSHVGFDLVELAGVALSVAGLIVLATRIKPFLRWRSGDADTDADTDTDGDAGRSPIAGSDGVDGDSGTATTPSTPVAVSSSGSGLRLGSGLRSGSATQPESTTPG